MNLYNVGEMNNLKKNREYVLDEIKYIFLQPVFHGTASLV